MQICVYAGHVESGTYAKVFTVSGSCAYSLREYECYEVWLLQGPTVYCTEAV